MHFIDISESKSNIETVTAIRILNFKIDLKCYFYFVGGFSFYISPFLLSKNLGTFCLNNLSMKREKKKKTAEPKRNSNSSDNAIQYSQKKEFI